jgi:hypothetical protein
MKAEMGAEDHMLEQFWLHHLFYFPHRHLHLLNKNTYENKKSKWLLLQVL